MEECCTIKLILLKGLNKNYFTKTMKKYLIWGLAVIAVALLGSNVNYTPTRQAIYQNLSQSSAKGGPIEEIPEQMAPFLEIIPSLTTVQPGKSVTFTVTKNGQAPGCPSISASISPNNIGFIAINPGSFFCFGGPATITYTAPDITPSGLNTLILTVDQTGLNPEPVSASAQIRLASPTTANRYSCSGTSCVLDPNGLYNSLNDCAATCIPLGGDVPVPPGMNQIRLSPQSVSLSAGQRQVFQAQWQDGVNLTSNVSMSASLSPSGFGNVTVIGSQVIYVAPMIAPSTNTLLNLTIRIGTLSATANITLQSNSGGTYQPPFQAQQGVCNLSPSDIGMLIGRTGTYIVSASFTPTIPFGSTLRYITSWDLASAPPIVVTGSQQGSAEVTVTLPQNITSNSNVKVRYEATNSFGTIVAQGACNDLKIVPVQPASLEITPSNTTLGINGQQQYKVIGTDGNPVPQSQLRDWRMEPNYNPYFWPPSASSFGTLTQSGLYTAPSQVPFVRGGVFDVTISVQPDFGPRLYAVINFRPY
jgi:hypothetical protein